MNVNYYIYMKIDNKNLLISNKECKRDGASIHVKMKTFIYFIKTVILGRWWSMKHQEFVFLPRKQLDQQNLSHVFWNSGVYQRLTSSRERCQRVNVVKSSQFWLLAQYPLPILHTSAPLLTAVHILLEELAHVLHERGWAMQTLSSKYQECAF